MPAEVLRLCNTALLLTSLLQTLAIGVGGGLGVGLANYLAEAVAMAVCIWLEQQGTIHRFIPGTAPFAEHPPSNVLAVGLPYIPLYYAVSLGWTAFGQRAALDFNPLNVWSFVTVAMLCHDAWFFTLHTLFHKIRRLYKHIHSMHHRLGASCSALGNAYADAVDVGLCFVGFHAALYAYLYHQPTWNPLAVVALIVVEVMTNIVGERLLSACMLSCGLHSSQMITRLFVCIMVPCPLFVFLVEHCMLQSSTQSVDTYNVQCSVCCQPWQASQALSHMLQRLPLLHAGHCGYQLPYWLHLLVTGGVGILPNTANSKTHYIHHLQPQYNRALYFIHWDYVSGTYRNSVKALK